MLGMSKSELCTKIGRGFRIPPSAHNIPGQEEIIQDILEKISSGVADAIAANNDTIRYQLQKAGLKI